MSRFDPPFENPKTIQYDPYARFGYISNYPFFDTPEQSQTINGLPRDLGVPVPKDMYRNTNPLGAMTSAIGMLGNAYNIADSYMKNPLEASAIDVPTSMYGISELSSMPWLESKTADDFGFKNLSGDILSGIGSGAMAGYQASGNPMGAVIGAGIGGFMNFGAGLDRNAHAKREAEKYEEARKRNEMNRMYALNLGSEQIARDRRLDYERGFVFEQGGPLDATNGVTKFEAGGSHESNPNGGIYQGTAADGSPNLVEEGEVKWKDYIFPKRMKPTKAMLKQFNLDTKLAGKNYAEIATEIQKESESRPNTPHYVQTMDEMMGRLRACHEEHQMRNQAKEMMKMMEALPPEAQMQMFEQMAVGQPNGMPQPTGEPMQMPAQEQMPLEQAQPGMMEQPMAACGGRQKSHKYAEGGDLNRFMKMMGFKTKSEYEKWMADNKIESMPVNFDNDSVDWQELSTLQSFLDAVKTSNPSLYHAIQQGYLTGKRDEARESSFHTERGHWDNPTGESWEGSLDEAWLQALEAADADGIDLTRANTRTLEKYLGATDAYNKSTDWLKENTDNRLKYLNSVINSQYTSPAAKAFAKRFVDDKGKWKKGVANDYNTIFGITRGKDPGDYWKSVYGALREQEENNLLFNPETGEYETLYGDPSEYIKDGTYDWADGLKDITNNYYRAKTATPQVETPTEEPLATDNPYPTYSMLPGIAQVGAGLMGMFNTPDFTKANELEAFRWQPRDYTPIGDYLRYTPLDENYIGNTLRSQAGATRRAIANHMSPSMDASLLAADYNALGAVGDAVMKMQEANEKNRQAVAAFNRGTNQYNAGEANTAEQANFGLQPYIYGQAKDVAEARDAATTLASEINSKALGHAINGLGKVYDTDYANRQLRWLFDNEIYPGVKYKN